MILHFSHIGLTDSRTFMIPFGVGPDEVALVTGTATATMPPERTSAHRTHHGPERDKAEYQTVPASRCPSPRARRAPPRARTATDRRPAGRAARPPRPARRRRPRRAAAARPPRRGSAPRAPG